MWSTSARLEEDRAAVRCAANSSSNFFNAQACKNVWRASVTASLEKALICFSPSSGATPGFETCWWCSSYIGMHWLERSANVAAGAERRPVDGSETVNGER